MSTLIFFLPLQTHKCLIIFLHTSSTKTSVFYIVHEWYTHTPLSNYWHCLNIRGRIMMYFGCGKMTKMKKKIYEILHEVSFLSPLIQSTDVNACNFHHDIRGHFKRLRLSSSYKKRNFFYGIN